MLGYGFNIFQPSDLFRAKTLSASSGLFLYFPNSLPFFFAVLVLIGECLSVWWARVGGAWCLGVVGWLCGADVVPGGRGVWWWVSALGGAEH